MADARADARAVGGTFAYEFRWRSPALGGIGACHCVDLPFVFDVLDADGVATVLGPEPPQRLADSMHRAWVDFIAKGDPSWPCYTTDRRRTMAFDDVPSVVDDPLRLVRETFSSA